MAIQILLERQLMTLQQASAMPSKCAPYRILGGTLHWCAVRLNYSLRSDSQVKQDKGHNPLHNCVKVRQGVTVQVQLGPVQEDWVICEDRVIPYSDMHSDTWI